MRRWARHQATSLQSERREGRVRVGYCIKYLVAPDQLSLIDDCLTSPDEAADQLEVVEEDTAGDGSPETPPEQVTARDETE